MHFAVILQQYTALRPLTLPEADSPLCSRADCAKARPLILEKPARWMASGCHFFHAPRPFTLPTFSVKIMLSRLMARPDALNLLAFTTCCMDWREVFPLVVIFSLGFRFLCVLSRCLGSNAKISAALSNTAPSPARRALSWLLGERFCFRFLSFWERFRSLGINAKRAWQSMNKNLNQNCAGEIELLYFTSQFW